VALLASGQPIKRRGSRFDRSTSSKNGAREGS
jgi:hypothetical protein